MKVSVTETVRKNINMHFEKFLKVPKWVYDYEECEKCGVQFDDPIFKDDDVIVAVGKCGEGFRKYYHYCLNCWKEEEDYIMTELLMKKRVFKK